MLKLFKRFPIVWRAAFVLFPRDIFYVFHCQTREKESFFGTSASELPQFDGSRCLWVGWAVRCRVGVPWVWAWNWDCIVVFFSRTGGESISKAFKFLGKCFAPTTATTTTSTPIVYISINLYLNFTFFICSQMRQRLWTWTLRQAQSMRVSILFDRIYLIRPFVNISGNSSLSLVCCL